MKTLRDLKLMSGKLDSRTARLILVILSLAMFVIGAGAPGGGSGWSG